MVQPKKHSTRKENLKDMFKDEGSKDGDNSQSRATPSGSEQTRITNSLSLGD